MLGYDPKRAEGEVIKGRSGIAFWCTDVNEAVSSISIFKTGLPLMLKQDGVFSYSYKLRPGINYDSHAIVRLAVRLEETSADKSFTESCQYRRHARIFSTCSRVDARNPPIKIQSYYIAIISLGYLSTFPCFATNCNDFKLYI